MLKWVAKMAWRDSRHSRKRLFLYMSSVVMGVAALVSVRSFGENLLEAVEHQAKALLGADLALKSRSAFDEADETLFDRLGGDRSRQTSFTSMVFLPKQKGTRLAEVRALSGDFPYYGALETEPADAGEAFQEGLYALADNTLMLQFGAQVGDPLKVGTVTFTIRGRLVGIPGESGAMSDLAPRVYIPGKHLAETGLIQLGSRVSYSEYFKFPSGFNTEALVEELESELGRNELSSDTVEERKEDFRRELGNLNRFLSLVAFIALTLGGIGVASSVNLYIRHRLSTVALLRCVGASPRQSVAIYLMQATSMGVLGALLGGLLGLLAQRILPFVLGGLIPLDLEVSISWWALLEGLCVGLVSAMLFAMIPLLPVRRVSPLLALRSDFEEGSKKRRDPILLTVYLLVSLGLLTFSLVYTSKWTEGLGFFLGLLFVFGLLFAVAKAIMVLTKRYFPSKWHYEWRQGLVNLYRPHNQTVVLMLAVGLGTFFIVTLYLCQLSLLHEVEFVGADGKPNLVFFDVQTDQREGVLEVVRSRNLPVLEDVPIVTMRISSIKGEELRRGQPRPKGRRPSWALRREYRSTYRGSLSETETLVKGTFEGTSKEGNVTVSLEQHIAEELKVDIGDRIVFDVQGVPVEVTVGSLREVAWQNFRPNFFVVFPTGVLEEAPQFHVIVTRTDSPEVSAAIQREMVTQFPNVSAIDLSLVLETIDLILGKLNFVIRFMALFSIVTGLIVLIGAIVSGRYQRMKESVLLRTLGASRGQILRILLIEYLFLGTFAALTGLILAIGGSWAITYFVFDSTFILSSKAVVLSLFVVIFLTITVGMTNSRGILDHPPLEVLRAED